MAEKESEREREREGGERGRERARERGRERGRERKREREGEILIDSKQLISKTWRRRRYRASGNCVSIALCQGYL